MISCRSPIEIEFDRCEQIVKQNEKFLKRIPGMDWFFHTPRNQPFRAHAHISDMCWNQNPLHRDAAKRAIDTAMNRMAEITDPQ